MDWKTCRLTGQTIYLNTVAQIHQILLLRNLSRVLQPFGSSPLSGTSSRSRGRNRVEVSLILRSLLALRRQRSFPSPLPQPSLKCVVTSFCSRLHSPAFLSRKKANCYQISPLEFPGWFRNAFWLEVDKMDESVTPAHPFSWLTCKIALLHLLLLLLLWTTTANNSNNYFI